MDADCELTRRCARLRGDAGAAGSRNVGSRRYVTSRDDRGLRRMALPGRIDQPVEGSAVAAGRAVGAESLHRIVVAMHDVGNGIRRERQQQADEHDSQPGGGPGNGCARQVENGHIAGRT